MFVDPEAAPDRVTFAADPLTVPEMLYRVGGLEETRDAHDRAKTAMQSVCFRWVEFECKKVDTLI